LASVNLRSGIGTTAKRFPEGSQEWYFKPVRRKRWFVSKSELRRIQKKKSIRRIRRRQTIEPE
jgi:hypothetical protein